MKMDQGVGTSHRTKHNYLKQHADIVMVSLTDAES